ncbi:MAG TPA: nuclear transport factor 2 family protein [Micromonosporaceae bacterium]
MTTMRSAEEVFAHHGQALGAEDVEEIVSDYTDDATLVLHGTVYRGKDGAREVFTQLLRDVPKATWDLDTVFADDILYLEWKARSGDTARHIDDGIDTFVFAEGKIRVQTVQYSVAQG